MADDQQDQQDPQDDNVQQNDDGSASIDLGDDEGDITEKSDGSAVMRLELDGPDEKPDFYANMAETIAPIDLAIVVMEYLDKIDQDLDDRKPRDEQYKEGLQRTGMGKEAPGGAQFQGASNSVHPVMLEACIDFSARAIKELFPPDGPVKTKIIGEVTDEKTDIAEKKKDFNNWQLTEQIEEFRDELETMFTQLPLGGSQYLLLCYDAQRKRPMAEFIPVDNMITPFASNNFYTSQRATHVQNITEFEMRSRVEQGLYTDFGSFVSSNEPDPTDSEVANRKIEGKQFSENIDGLRKIYHIYAWMEVKEDTYSKGKMAPYILMIDVTENRCVGLYRNWEAGDKSMKKLDWIIEFKFVPWRGSLGIGLAQMIGSLSAAATGSLRALLDSAHINNAATLVAMKGSGISGQSDTVEVTEVTEIEAPVGVDDIRKAIMPMPFNPPSPMLFQLLGFCVDAAKGVVTTAEEKIADATSQMPVGTTQALIEQGAAVFSAIHSRLHRSQARVIQVLNRINRWYLDDMNTDDIPDGLSVQKAYFNRNSDVIPVSDPHIFSETQRIAQNQAVLQLATQFPDLFDRREVVMRTLSQLKIADVNKLMPEGAKPQEINAAEENVAMTMGHLAFAYPGQDHLSHLQVHLIYALSPMFGASQLIAPQFMHAALEHVKQHITMWYRDTINQYAGHGSAVNLNKYDDKKLTRDIDKLMLQASQHVMLDAQQVFQGMMPGIQQMMQIAQQMTPKPQQDPVLQASLAETSRRAQDDKVRAQLDQQRLQQEADKAQKDREVKVATNAEDNLTHERIEAAKLTSEHLLQHEDQLHAAQERRAATLDQMIQPGGVQ